MASSSPFSIRVRPASNLLAAAVGGLAPDSFLEFAGNGLGARVAHPTSGNQVNVLEDGRNPSGYQVLGYCGKGCFDPVSGRVLWMGCGASSGDNQNWEPGAYVWNTRPIYTLATNAWTVERAFRGTDEDSSAEAIGHQYDGNCIDVAGRRLYKLKKDTNRILAYDLDAGSMRASIAGPSGISSSSTWGALEVVPTRGTAGALWLLNWTGANELRLWEYDLASGAWSVLLGSRRFGGIGNGPTMSFNPRAGSAGAVMLGNLDGAWIVDCQSLAVTDVELPGGRRIDVASGESSGFCRDPLGDGWLKFSDNTKRVYRYSGGSWQQRGVIPTPAGGWVGDFITVPMDAFGVVWLVSYSAGPSAFLYRP